MVVSVLDVRLLSEMVLYDFEFADGVCVCVVNVFMCVSVYVNDELS